MKKKYTNKYPIVFIVYRDIVLWDRQTSIEGDFPVHIYHVAGFLIRETEDTYIVSRELVSNQNDDLRGAMTIPRETVLHFEVIKH